MITLKQKNNYILHNQRPFQNKNQLMYFISLSLCLYFCPVQKAVIHFSFIDGKKGEKIVMSVMNSPTEMRSTVCISWNLCEMLV